MKMRNKLIKISLLFSLFHLTLFFLYGYAADTTGNIQITLQRKDTLEKRDLGDQWIGKNWKAAEIYGTNILWSMENYSKRPASLLVLEDIPTLSLWEMRKTSQIPASCTIYDFDGTFFETLKPFLPGTTVDEIFRGRQSAEKKLIETHTPVYSTARRDILDMEGYEVIPCGMVYLFWTKGMEKPDYRELVKLIRPLEPYLGKELSKEERNMCAITHYMRGLNYQQLPQPWAKSSAIVEMRKASEFSGDLNGIHVMLAESFAQLKDWADAYDSAQVALVKRPENPRIYFILGDYYFALGAWDSAIEYYTKGMQRDSNNVEVYLNLARSYEKKGILNVALENYKVYLQKSPKSPQAREVQRRIKALSKK